MSFQNLGLSESVLHGAQRMGYSEPTPIQLRAAPLILAGRDLIASAQTGTGKTAAFALPVLSMLDHLTARVDAKREPVRGDEVLPVLRKLALAPGTTLARYSSSELKARSST